MKYFVLFLLAFTCNYSIAMRSYTNDCIYTTVRGNMRGLNDSIVITPQLSNDDSPITLKNIMVLVGGAGVIISANSEVEYKGSTFKLANFPAIANGKVYMHINAFGNNSGEYKLEEFEPGRSIFFREDGVGFLSSSRGELRIKTRFGVHMADVIDFNIDNNNVKIYSSIDTNISIEKQTTAGITLMNGVDDVVVTTYNIAIPSMSISTYTPNDEFFCFNLARG